MSNPANVIKYNAVKRDQKRVLEENEKAGGINIPVFQELEIKMQELTKNNLINKEFHKILKQKVKNCLIRVFLEGKAA